MSDFDHSEFGHWDADSASYYSDYVPPYRRNPLPQLARRSQPFTASPSPSPAWTPSSPPRRSLSPEGLNVALPSPLALVLEQVGSPQAPSAVTTPVARSPSPELRYPSPAPLPSSPPSVRLVTPVPVVPAVLPGTPLVRPASAVGYLRITTPDLRPLSPPPRPATPDSPIDYEAAALRVEAAEAAGPPQSSLNLQRIRRIAPQPSLSAPLLVSEQQAPTPTSTSLSPPLVVRSIAPWTASVQGT